MSDDIHIDYSLARRGDWEEYFETPDPHGLSGGPVWSASRAEKDEVWVAEEAVRFVGIMYCWSPENTCIVAHPMRRWVGMMDSLFHSDDWSLVMSLIEADK